MDPVLHEQTPNYRNSGAGKNGERMNKDDLLADEIPDQGSLATNWEYRISMLDHDVSVLRGTVPKGKIRRVFWLLFNGSLVATPIVGGYAAIYGEDPWKTTVVAGAFGIIVGKTLVEFFTKISQGPRPHRSILLKDQR